ncbi:hypothetical protein AB0K61_20130, partial [Streptomyces syringium]|uniref:hypothetical protein n=1 Tax=Streptomyces syringium TaxID=76729 RepID=UPI0034465616
MSTGEDDSASSTSAALSLVRANVLELLKGFDSPPRLLRVQAGGVTLEAEWPQSPPAVNGAAPPPVDERPEAGVPQSHQRLDP